MLREWREHMGRREAVKLAAAGISTGFSQGMAARFLGVSRRTYEAWERESNPREPVGLVRRVVEEKVRGTYRVRKRWRYR